MVDSIQVEPRTSSAEIEGMNEYVFGRLIFIYSHLSSDLS